MSTDLRPEPMGLAVSIARCRKYWHDAGWVTSNWVGWGSAGYRIQVQRRDDLTSEIGTVIVSQAIVDGDDWIHASISFPDREPTYAELALLHKSVFGPKRWAFQVFATEERHISFHAHALHLWGRADGTNVLPDFGRYGMV